MEQAGEKSQDATPHRREQAREEGQVAQSQDLAASLILVVGMAVLLAMGGRVAEFLGNLLNEVFAFLVRGDGARVIRRCSLDFTYFEKPGYSLSIAVSISLIFTSRGTM